MSKAKKYNVHQAFKQLALILLLTGGFPSLQGNTATDLEREEAKLRLAQLQKEISELQSQLQESRTEHKNEQLQLRNLDLSIQATAKRLRELSKEKKSYLSKLNQLQKQRDDYLDSLQERQSRLGNQIASTYRLANQSRVKLVLNQDSPAKLNRMLAYYDHINRAQLAKITTLKKLLLNLQYVESQIDQELTNIKAAEIEHKHTLDQQNEQRLKRENLLATLSSRIKNESAELVELERNREALEIILERIGDVLADIPKDLGQYLDIAAQKGKLQIPVKGKVRKAFGQQRAAGMKWHGWLLEASTGAEVNSVAYGRVAFANWLRGYGLLMIIDHGQGFMSLYGYNESLLWEVGDWVEPGAVIATVGTSPGGEQGLYFEMRKEGKAVDPAVWLKR